MQRNLIAERRIRAIAAVHALAGSAFILCEIWAVVKMSHRTHGPNDLAGAAMPVLAAAFFIAGLSFSGLAILLWFYRVISKWLTVVMCTVTSMVCVYEFLKYDVERIRIEAKVLNTGVESHFYKYIGYSSAELLLALWGFVVVLSLLRSGSREVFTRDYRMMLRTAVGSRIPFHTSPVFVLGLVVWIVLAAALSQ